MGDMVVKNKVTDLAAVDYGEHAGVGYENTTADDFAIPYLNLLQSNSPQVEDEDHDARMGMFMNSVTGTLFDGKEGIEVVVAYRERVYKEWVPRSSGGGLAGIHEVGSEAVQACTLMTEIVDGKEKKVLRAENGNEMVDSRDFYCVMTNPQGGISPIVISCSKTKIKPARHLLSTLDEFRLPSKDGGEGPKPPIYAFAIRVRSVDQEGGGKKFKNFEFTPAGGSPAESLIAPDDPRFIAAMALRKSVTSGESKAANDSLNNDGGGGGQSDDDVPF